MLWLAGRQYLQCFRWQSTRRWIGGAGSLPQAHDVFADVQGSAVTSVVLIDIIDISEQCRGAGFQDRHTFPEAQRGPVKA
jgi:hypothetical protein